MNCTKTHDQQAIHLKLPIAPQANHRLGTAPDNKTAPAMMPVEAVSWIRELRKGAKHLKPLNSAALVTAWLPARQHLPPWNYCREKSEIQSFLSPALALKQQAMLINWCAWVWQKSICWLTLYSLTRRPNYTTGYDQVKKIYP